MKAQAALISTIAFPWHRFPTCIIFPSLPFPVPSPLPFLLSSFSHVLEKQPRYPLHLAVAFLIIVFISPYHTSGRVMVLCLFYLSIPVYLFVMPEASHTFMPFFPFVCSMVRVLNAPFSFLSPWVCSCFCSFFV